MSKSDFEKRLERIGKPPSVGARRIVHKAMLQQEIAEMRERNDRDAAREDDDASGPEAFLWALIMFIFLVLSSLFMTDAEAAARAAWVVVPLVVFLIGMIFLRDARRHGVRSIFWNILDSGGLILRLLRMLR